MDDITDPYKSLQEQVEKHERTIEQLVQIIAATNRKVAELQVMVETLEERELKNIFSTPPSISNHL